MKRIMVIVVLTVIPAIAFADPVTLSYQDASNVFLGLNALNGYTDVVKDGGQDKVVPRQYDLTMNTRIAIARDLAAIRAAAAPIEKATQEAQQTIKNDPKYKTDTERNAALSAMVAEESAEKLSIDLTKLSVADLKLEVNKAISPVTLMQLAPLLSDGDIGPKGAAATPAK